MAQVNQTASSHYSLSSVSVQSKWGLTNCPNLSTNQLNMVIVKQHQLEYSSQTSLTKKMIQTHTQKLRDHNLQSPVLLTELQRASTSSTTMQLIIKMSANCCRQRESILSTIASWSYRVKLNRSVWWNQKHLTLTIQVYSNTWRRSLEVVFMLRKLRNLLNFLRM